MLLGNAGKATLYSCHNNYREIKISGCGCGRGVGFGPLMNHQNLQQVRALIGIAGRKNWGKKLIIQSDCEIMLILSPVQINLENIVEIKQTVREIFYKIEIKNHNTRNDRVHL